MKRPLAAQLVVHGNHAEPVATRDERRIETGSGAERTRLGLVDVRDRRGASRCERSAVARARDRPSMRPVGTRGRGAPRRARRPRRRRRPRGASPPSVGRTASASARVGQASKPFADERQQTLDVGLVDNGSDRLVQDLELAGPPRRRLVETRVLDRDGGLRCEEPDELLVVVGEVAALLLREIEVAVRDAAQHHGHAQKRVHRRMTRREADGARVVAEMRQPERRGFANQDAEDPAAARKIADRRSRLFVDAGRDEALEGCAASRRSRRAPRSARR